MRHVISALVTNEPGVLANVAGMFAARGFNIDSLVVGRTEDPEMSRMIVVVEGDAHTIKQVQTQLAKLVPVAKVSDLSESTYVERDLALVRVDAPPAKRNEIIEVVNMFRGKVVDVATDSIAIEISGSEQKVEAFLSLVGEYGIREMARTGVIAMTRGHKGESLTPTRNYAADAAGNKRVRSFENQSGDALPPS